jgi:hypothetical protein
MEDEPTAGSGGVECFVQGLEPDAAAAQFADDGDQVLQAAAETPQLKNDDGVPAPQVVQALGQLRAVGVLAAELLLEDPLTAGRGEGVDLAVKFLVTCGDPGVPDQRACAADRVDRITVNLSWARSAIVVMPWTVREGA